MNENKPKDSDSSLMKTIRPADIEQLKVVLTTHLAKCDAVLEKMAESKLESISVKGWGSINHHLSRLHAALKNAIGESEFPTSTGTMSTVDENVEQVKAMRKKKP